MLQLVGFLLSCNWSYLTLASKNVLNQFVLGNTQWSLKRLPCIIFMILVCNDDRQMIDLDSTPLLSAWHGRCECMVGCKSKFLFRNLLTVSWIVVGHLPDWNEKFQISLWLPVMQTLCIWWPGKLTLRVSRHHELPWKVVVDPYILDVERCKAVLNIELG